MTPLAILLAEPRDERLWAALSLAAASAASGRRVSLFFSGEAVQMAGRRFRSGADGKRSAYGVATLSELFASCDELGVRFIACQTGMHLSELQDDALRPGVEPGGLIGWLAETTGAERVVV
jgi:predicted peroxiredoxin